MLQLPSITIFCKPKKKPIAICKPPTIATHCLSCLQTICGYYLLSAVCANPLWMLPTICNAYKPFVANAYCL
jgi:hypothetical protein